MFILFHFLFSEEKSFFFSFLSFFQICFTAGISIIVQLFLRSRCSMEMWCPDDIGRDSWDRVGPPAWVRACFNSPEGNGTSSPVETKPLQIVFLLFLFLLFLLLLLFRSVYSTRVYPQRELMQRKKNLITTPHCKNLETWGPAYLASANSHPGKTRIMTSSLLMYPQKLGTRKPRIRTLRTP